MTGSIPVTETGDGAHAPVPADPVPARASRSSRGRVLRAAVELVLASALGWLTFWLWPHGIGTITMVLEDGTELVSTRYHGNWITLAIMAGAVSVVLVADAVRQFVSRSTGP
jgi:hypothetical protein